MKSGVVVVHSMLFCQLQTSMVERLHHIACDIVLLSRIDVEIDEYFHGQQTSRIVRDFLSIGVAHAWSSWNSYCSRLASAVVEHRCLASTHLPPPHAESPEL